MRPSVLAMLFLAISACQDSPVQSDVPLTHASNDAISASVLGAGASGLYEACFDPSEGVCFNILSIRTQLVEDRGTVWIVRTSVEMRYEGRAVPISPLDHHHTVGALTARRKTGGGQAVTVTSGNINGDLFPGRTIVLTGVNGFQKSDFDWPITFGIDQFIQLDLDIYTPDGRLWPGFFCKIAEGTCYTGR